MSEPHFHDLRRAGNHFLAEAGASLRENGTLIIAMEFTAVDENGWHRHYHAQEVGGGTDEGAVQYPARPLLFRPAGG